MSQTATKTSSEQTDAIRLLQCRLRDGDIVHTMTTHGKGETSWVRVFITEGRAIEDITGQVARATGARFVNDNRRFGIAKRGCQYNKGAEVASELRLAVELELPWIEL